MRPSSKVSIQLVSPASGDGSINECTLNWTLDGFHSISFPSEWGPKDDALSLDPEQVEFPFN